jgi:hypothetical protein
MCYLEGHYHRETQILSPMTCCYSQVWCLFRVQLFTGFTVVQAKIHQQAHASLTHFWFSHWPFEDRFECISLSSLKKKIPQYHWHGGSSSNSPTCLYMYVL